MNKNQLIVKNIRELTHFLGKASRNLEAVMIIDDDIKTYINLSTGEVCIVLYI